MEKHIKLFNIQLKYITKKLLIKESLGMKKLLKNFAKALIAQIPHIAKRVP